MKHFSIIVAIAENHEIGKDNDLLWHISEDLKRFKKITTGNVIIMGRRTYLSLPRRPLPNRTNIVISDVPDEQFEGCIMADSIKNAMESVREFNFNLIDNVLLRGKEQSINIYDVKVT